MLEIAVIVTLSIIFLITIALPLKNFFQQRNEITRVQASIAQQEQKKEELQTEIEKYHSKAYLEEQARNRLGVIAPGETAFRIVDPAMQENNRVTSDKADVEKRENWYETLWTSISEEDAATQLGETETEKPAMNMPIAPTP